METERKNILFDPYITPEKAAGKRDIKPIKRDCILPDNGRRNHLPGTEDCGKNSGVPLPADPEPLYCSQEKVTKNKYPLTTCDNAPAPKNQVVLKALKKYFAFMPAGESFKKIINNTA